MKNINDKIISNPLFNGISASDFSSMLSCLGGFEKTFGKNETIIQTGDSIDFVGLVTQGSVKITHTDYQGNEVLVATVDKGDLFAEVFACVETISSPVSVIAIETSRVLLFDYRKMISTCSASCPFHQKLVANMLNVVARKTLYLNRKIDVLSKRSLREKILTYLHYESQGAQTFTIALNRENLANFLCADRSALSNELSKMQRDGLIAYHKNTFELLP